MYGIIAQLRVTKRVAILVLCKHLHGNLVSSGADAAP